MSFVANRVVLIMMMMMLTLQEVMALSPSRKPFMGKPATTTQFASSLSSPAQDLPAWSNLPFKRNDIQEEQQPPPPPVWNQMELIIGRLAVVSAGVLIGTEIGTGESFPEQIMDVFQAISSL